MPATLETTYGDAAAGALSFPMAPQLLTGDELEVIAGSLQGWDLIGEYLDPALAAWTRIYGGGVVDGHLKLKLQTWFRNWVEPERTYVVHRPRVSNGQWFRLFRTGMRVAERISQAMKDVRDLNEEEVVARYDHYLGVGARGRFETFEGWWKATLACIQQGDWHLAVYSPKWGAFISPVIDEYEGEGLVGRCLAEFPPVSVHLYPGSAPGAGVWNLAEAIRDGAFVEVLGEMTDAPPFGKWGDGAVVPFPGGGGRVVSGFIHHSNGRCQCVKVASGEMSTVEVDAPNLGAFLQDVYAVTGWRHERFSREVLAGGDPDGLEAAVVDLTDGFTRILAMPGQVFHEAVLSHPRIIPVFGRLVSTLPHIDLDPTPKFGVFGHR